MGVSSKPHTTDPKGSKSEAPRTYRNTAVLFKNKTYTARIYHG